MLDQLSQDIVSRAVSLTNEQGFAVCISVVDGAELGVRAQPGGDIYSLESTNGGLISFGGGIVLHDRQGKVIGGLGISGATVEADQVIALGAGRPQL